MHKPFQKIFIVIFLGLTYGKNIEGSRHTALTRAIEKVGPAVASINVE